MRLLKPALIFTDICLIVYWILISINIIPLSIAFKDYSSPTMHAWNWSFFPLDLLASLTGLIGTWLKNKQKYLSTYIIVVSLSLTFCAGLMAIGFWWIYKDFNITWWIPNLFLILMPLFFAITALKKTHNNDTSCLFSRRNE